MYIVFTVSQFHADTHSVYLVYKIDFVRDDDNNKPEDHWSCIAHLSAEDMLKSAVIQDKKFTNIESK